MSESDCEMLETFDDTGRSTGLYPRSVVHASGLWHRSVNVIVFTSDDRLILQRRSQHKDVCAGAWDLSVAEHLKPGESFLEAAERGLKEELSLDSMELEPVGSELRHVYAPTNSDTQDREIQRLFVGSTDFEPRHNPIEIEETRYVLLEEVMELSVASPEVLTPWFRAWIGALAQR